MPETSFCAGAPAGHQLPERLLGPGDERVAVQALDRAVHRERRGQVRGVTGPGVVGDRGEAGPGFQPVQPVHPVRPVPVGVPRPAAPRGAPPGSAVHGGGEVVGAVVDRDEVDEPGADPVPPPAACPPPRSRGAAGPGVGGGSRTPPAAAAPR